PTAVLMVAAARARLGLIDERYADLPAERARLRGADAALADLQAAIRAGRTDTATALDRWVAASHPLEARLRATRARSLFDPAHLDAAANRRLPPRPS
ncbi:MAG: hypothetical protein KIS90_05475, partial [Phenylobacterium sp.]|nr:hypothetical protein [Phenylobacterium sp.]